MTHRTITQVDSVATSNMNHLDLHASIQGPKYTTVSLELHRPSVKGTKLLFQVTKATIIVLRTSLESFQQYPSKGTPLRLYTLLLRWAMTVKFFLRQEKGT